MFNRCWSTKRERAKRVECFERRFSGDSKFIVRVTALRGLDNGGERMSVENTSTTYLGRITAFHANYEFDNATLIQLLIAIWWVVTAVADDIKWTYQNTRVSINLMKH
jgi:hypothetical protein